jgi:hypothetical protein
MGSRSPSYFMSPAKARYFGGKGRPPHLIDRVLRCYAGVRSSSYIFPAQQLQIID